MDDRDIDGLVNWKGGSSGEVVPSVDDAGETACGAGRCELLVETRGLAGTCKLISASVSN